MTKRIDYLNDELTKNLFKKKHILLHFINSVLSYSNKPIIYDFTYKDREIDPRFFKGKSSFLDIYIKTSNDESINIEVQKEKEENFIKRTLRYLFRLADCEAKGDDDSVMHRTVSINLINYDLDELPFANDFHYSSGIRNDQPPHQLMIDVVELHFINIIKWRKLNKRIIEKIDAMSPLSKWTAFFYNRLKKEERLALVRSESMLQEAYDTNLEYLSKSENRIAYIKAEKMATHERAVIRKAVNDAKREMVQKMKRKKMDIAEIMEITGWTEEQILACPVQ